MGQQGSSTEITVDAVETSLERHSRLTLARDWADLGTAGQLQAVSLAARDFVVEKLIATERRALEGRAKRVHYLSMEFLMGRSLGSHLANLRATEVFRDALARRGVDLDAVIAAEDDAALGNGGLGRLAACFLDSLASLGYAACGHGINYEFGLFRQEIQDGRQRERPDQWLAQRSPWQIERADETCVVPLHGRVEHATDRSGAYNPMWLEWDVIIGVPYVMPVVGLGGETVNTLRLYSARASDEFDMAIFNDGDFHRAVQAKVASETVSKVLYPTDAVEHGRELRLIQEYFLVGCAIRSITEQFLAEESDIRRLPDRVAIQMNDTHPTLAVAELMRLLLDEHDLAWDDAWGITRATLAYTNHTLLPEALERWPVPLLGKTLPRHLQLILEINRRHLDAVNRVWPGEPGRLERLSIVDEQGEKHVRMANLAIVGSHAVNGVSRVHTELLESQLVPDFHEFRPEIFSNKTNGVTQRRWMLLANPGLSALLQDAIGDGWLRDLNELRRIDALADDSVFRNRIEQIKRQNKERLCRLIRSTVRVDVDPSSLFDVHAKRIHEYKRQLLNVLRILSDYTRIDSGAWEPPVPRTYIFAGKAAPGYRAAKEIVKLIHDVASLIDRSSRARRWMQVVFLPDYRVSLAEVLIPAADLSEQISTAGMEASGTGNMKFAMNGALTVGTLDGANIEMREEVGEENFFSFGLTAEQISDARATGSYRPRDLYELSESTRIVVDSLRARWLRPHDPGAYDWIYHELLTHGDRYFLIADLGPYLELQDEIADVYVDSERWTRMAVRNIARMGKFSSDRTIDEYAREIWNVSPMKPAALEPQAVECLET